MIKDKIVDVIKANLTGDKNKDIPYLIAQLRENISDPLGVIIAFECSKLIYEMIEEEEKEEYREGLIKDIINNSPIMLRQISMALDDQDLELATEIAIYLVELIEEFNIEDLFPSEDYKDYNSPFELVIDIFKGNDDYMPPKDLPLPLSIIFYQLGSLLFENKRPYEAIKYLKKAIEYSPTTVQYYIELSEAYKLVKEFDKAFDVILKALELSYSNEEIAHCYRSLGYIFVEKNLLEEALTLYRLSLDFDERLEIVMPEIHYIFNKAGKELPFSNFDDMRAMLDRYNIPLGANSDIVSLAYSFAKNKFLENDLDQAEYFAQIGYDLTELDDFKDILDLIESRR